MGRDGPPLVPCSISGRSGRPARRRPVEPCRTHPRPGREDQGAGDAPRRAPRQGVLRRGLPGRAEEAAVPPDRPVPQHRVGQEGPCRLCQDGKEDGRRTHGRHWQGRQAGKVLDAHRAAQGCEEDGAGAGRGGKNLGPHQGPIGFAMSHESERPRHYKKRRGIETRFKMVSGGRDKTPSTLPKAWFLCFASSLLASNMWVVINLELWGHPSDTFREHRWRQCSPQAFECWKFASQNRPPRPRVGLPAVGRRAPLPSLPEPALGAKWPSRPFRGVWEGRLDPAAHAYAPRTSWGDRPGRSLKVYQRPAAPPPVVYATGDEA